jgi:hypothetical protein
MIKKDKRIIKIKLPDLKYDSLKNGYGSLIAN